MTLSVVDISETVWVRTKADVAVVNRASRSRIEDTIFDAGSLAALRFENLN